MCALNVPSEALDADNGSYNRIVNDFGISVATKNGSGSQTSNQVLIRSLFKMGIPVNGKNLFPSNIKGLPTWYTIRASNDGYTARRDVTEIAITFNLDTAAEDIAALPAGGVCILPQEWNWTHSRSDIIYYEVPVKEMMKQSTAPKQFHDRIGNMVYVGAVSQLFGIPQDIIYQALVDSFKGKEKPARMNMEIIEMAAEWVDNNVPKQDSFYYEMSDQTEGKILITGNEAGALGALFGGVTVASWYPITPSTSVIDGLMAHKDIRRDPETNAETVAIVQAEDELSAIGMVIGAGWAGARAMTATSGPGISLMSEFAGLAYFAEIPAVIWDITRVGPSTGLPTRTSQGDLQFLYYLGHGDSRHVVLLPGSVAECFEFGWRSFDLAEELQTLVLVMSDLDLGMNLWMSDTFDYPNEPMKRGKVLRKEQLEEFYADNGEWGRYKDYDGDGIPYRTLPGTDHPRAAYFTRGTGHDEYATYSEKAEDWLHNLERLHRKFETARTLVPAPIVDYDASKSIGIISYGSNDPAVEEGRDRLEDSNIATNYLRLRALPISREVFDFIAKHDRIYIIENNFDGQLYQILLTEVPEHAAKLVKTPLGDSLPMTAKWIHEQVSQKEQGK